MLLPLDAKVCNEQVDVDFLQTFCLFSEKWLLDSDIVLQDPKEEECGGIFSWSSTSNSNARYLYPEISGYYLTWLAFQYLTQKALLEQCPENQTLVNQKLEEYELRMQITSNWLIEKVMEAGDFYARYNPVTGQVDVQQYVFDIAMVGNGLANVYQILHSAKILTAVQTIKEKIVKLIQKHEYIVKWCFEEKRNLVGLKWSTQDGTFLLKIILFLANYQQITGDEEVLEVIDRVMQKYAARQVQNGRFITNDQDQTTYLHAFFYTLEAYWVAGQVLSNESYLEIAKKGVHWYTSFVNRNGFSGLVSQEESPLLDGIGGDALSQYIRMLTLVGDEVDLEKPVSYLYQNSLDIAEDFISVKYGYSITNQYHGDRNTWATLFANQAINLLVDPGKKELMELKPYLLV